jgi:HSP20 family protein
MRQRMCFAPGMAGGVPVEMARLFGEATVAEKKPRTNISDLGDRFLIELQVPGFLREAIDIEVLEKELKISGKQTEEVKSNQLTHEEFRLRSFERRFKLNENLNTDQIKARLDLGILRIEVPKKEAQAGVQRKVVIDPAN